MSALPVCSLDRGGPHGEVRMSFPYSTSPGPANVDGIHRPVADRRARWFSSHTCLAF